MSPSGGFRTMLAFGSEGLKLKSSVKKYVFSSKNFFRKNLEFLSNSKNCFRKGWIHFLWKRGRIYRLRMPYIPAHMFISGPFEKYGWSVATRLLCSTQILLSLSDENCPTYFLRSVLIRDYNTGHYTGFPSLSNNRFPPIPIIMDGWGDD